MRLHDAVVCCDSRSGSIRPSPSANPHLCNWQPPPWRKPFHVLRLVWYRGLQLFHHLFRTLIRQSKGLYYTALLSSLGAPWPAGAFWQCFAPSAVVSSQQFCHIGQLHRVSPHSGCWHFSWHWFSCTVIFGAVSLLSCKLVTLMNCPLLLLLSVYQPYIYIYIYTLFMLLQYEF